MVDQEQVRLGKGTLILVTGYCILDIGDGILDQIQTRKQMKDNLNWFRGECSNLMAPLSSRDSNPLAWPHDPS